MGAASGGDAVHEHRVYWQRDQLDAGIARYLAGAAKRSPLVRQNALAALLEWSGPNDTALLARKTPEEELTSSNSVLNLTETVFRKSLEEAPFHGGNRALGVKIDGRWAVFYHPGDINDAWKDGHSGAAKEVANQAYKLGVNVMYYAFNAYYARHFEQEGR